MYKDQSMFIEELEIGHNIVRKNRHNCFTGEWYGPDPEIVKAGPSCSCAGCSVSRTFKEGKNV